jgi:hypothetical protein
MTSLPNENRDRGVSREAVRPMLLGDGRRQQL